MTVRYEYGVRLPSGRIPFVESTDERAASTLSAFAPGAELVKRIITESEWVQVPGRSITRSAAEPAAAAWEQLDLFEVAS